MKKGARTGKGKGKGKGSGGPASLASLAEIVGRLIEEDHRAEALDTVASLTELPAMGPSIAAAMLAEARRAAPRPTTLTGFSAMLAMGLDAWRISANGGDREAREALADVRAMIEDAAAARDLPLHVLLDIAQSFARAQLETGPALQQAANAAMEEAAAGRVVEATPRAVAANLAALAAAVGDDPFVLHQTFAETIAAFPLDRRAEMVRTLAVADQATVREAALGFAFAAEPELADAALAAVGARGPGAPVSSVLVERLVRMRPWLAPRRQAAVDDVLRTLRPRAQAPQAQLRPVIQQVYATLTDGAGAETLSVAVRHGKRMTLATVLVKLALGVVDCVVMSDLSASESKRLLRRLTGEVGALPVSVASFERRLAAALAANVARDVPPPFGLLAVLEAAGIGALPPRGETAAEIADALLADVPAAKKGADALRATEADIDAWREQFVVLQSWLEDGEEVDALLGPLRSDGKRLEAVMTRLLPESRAGWAERCAWAAVMVKDSAGRDPDAWIPFALTARALAGDSPLADIPLAWAIAELTVIAATERLDRD